jgi:hypothetical protein
VNSRYGAALRSAPPGAPASRDARPMYTSDGTGTGGCRTDRTGAEVRLGGEINILEDESASYVKPTELRWADHILMVRLS